MNLRKSINTRHRTTETILIITNICLIVFCFGKIMISYGQPGQAVESNQKMAPISTVPFDADHWNLGDDVEIISFEGRTALTGTAFVKDVDFLNGTLEADIWTTGEVNFAGFIFRVQSFDEVEWFWLRMHKTNGQIADAIQYAPAYNGLFCWQLNPIDIGPANVPKNEWVHMKLEALNNSATLFVKDMAKPVMTVDHLWRGLQSGSVGLKTYGKEGVYFSNFSYKIDESSKVVLPKKGVLPPNMVSKWQLSPSYPLQQIDSVPTVYPAHQLAEIKQWILPDADASGLVNIGKYHVRRALVPGKPDYTILRTFIHTTQDKRVKMNFGYSDTATIFLNQIPLFSGNNAFLSRNNADGEWISFNDAVFLDLKKGRNELLVIIAEDFGGWAFQAKLDDTDGIEFHSHP